MLDRYKNISYSIFDNRLPVPILLIMYCLKGKIMAIIIKRYGHVSTIHTWSGLIDNDPNKKWEKLLLCIQYYDEDNTRFGKKSSVILQVNEDDLSKMLGNKNISSLSTGSWEFCSIQEYSRKPGEKRQYSKKYETLLSVYEADK